MDRLRQGLGCVCSHILRAYCTLFRHFDQGECAHALQLLRGGLLVALFAYVCYCCLCSCAAVRQGLCIAAPQIQPRPVLGVCEHIVVLGVLLWYCTCPHVFAVFCRPYVVEQHWLWGCAGAQAGCIRLQLSPLYREHPQLYVVSHTNMTQPYVTCFEGVWMQLHT